MAGVYESADQRILLVTAAVVKPGMDFLRNALKWVK